MAGIPESKPTTLPLLERRALLEILTGGSAVAGTVGASVSAYTNSSAPSWVYPVVIAGGGIGSIALWLKARQAHREDQSRGRAPDVSWLIAPLHTLHAELCADLGVQADAPSGTIRIALHRVDWAHPDEAKRLEQSVEYVGVVLGNKQRRGRRFPLRAGVIGRCAKDGTPIHAHRKSEDIVAFRNEMVTQWHFTAEEAKGLSDDRWSYAAYPILLVGKREAGAVLYVDTSKRGAFKSKAVQAKLLRWCEGFAEFLRIDRTGV